MFEKHIPFFVLILYFCKCVLTQGLAEPNDILFYDMEKNGTLPENANFKLELSDRPNLNVTVFERNDYDNEDGVITNKSKLTIKWNYNPNIIHSESTFTIKLLSNVTQNNITKLFYSVDETEIATNIKEMEYQYKVPKLNENYVYNIAVISSQDVQRIRDIGLSKTYIYKLYEKSSTIIDNNAEEKGISPFVFVGIGIGCIIILGVAFFISKKIGKQDEESNENINYKDFEVSSKSPSSTSGKIDYKQYGLRSPDSDEKNYDRNSIVSDDTGEVSWSNLEIAITSQQTKNEADDHVYRTLDKTYKRNKSSKNEYIDDEEQLYKVVRIFTPNEDDEISLNIGDDIQITVMFEDGWCEGLNKSTNNKGIFPRTCVVETEKYASMLENSKNSTLPNRRRSKHMSNLYNNNYKSTEYMLHNNSIPEIEIDQYD